MQKRIDEGKVAVVTGGGSGIGQALGELLARRGAMVVLADLDEDKARAVAEGIREAGGRARAERVDVGDADQVEALVAGVFEQEGRLDYLFNNAGIAVFGEVRDMTLEQWNRLLQVNVHGVVHGIVAAYGRMIDQGFGHIVNTASLAGLVPAPSSTAYVATKHAVVGLSTSLRGEAAAYGVKVSVVCPGLIDTPMKDNLTYLHLDKGAMVARAARFFVTPEHCARVALKGVDRNRPIITVTALARGSWWLYRAVPGLVSSRLGTFMMGQVRRRFAARPEKT